jgi:2,3,4,5-tetrahydropyridine-2,6-dicarboxylate N-acetyltransferase
MNYKQIAALIAKSPKKTPAKVWLRGSFRNEDFKGEDFMSFGEGRFWVLIGDYARIEKWLKSRRARVKAAHLEITARYSALPLADLTKVKARVEPGAIIRQGALVGRDCVIMMGAVINIGARVGARTMVDMNAVVGARAVIGRNCHIGAGAIVAGVLEPPSLKPVVIEDEVLVGANAVVLEGVRVRRGSVVAAGAVVVRDVPSGTVVAGVPAKVIKKVADIDRKDKVSLLAILRGTE